MQFASKTTLLSTGLRTHYLEWGGDDETLDHTVVLVHGFLDAAYGWVRAVQAGLAGSFHVVAPDMRGHGDSARIGPGGYYHFVDYVADLHSLVETTARNRMSLVGHSMGGMICGYYAGTYPDRVERLALLEGLGPPEPGTPGPDRMREWISAWSRARALGPTRHATLEDAAARLRKNDSLLSVELSLELAGQLTRVNDDGTVSFKHDPLHLTRGPHAFRVDSAQEFWRRIDCPVLLVNGEKSSFRYMESDGERRAAALQHATSAVIAGAGHMMQRHAPAALAQRLSAFLNRP